MGVQLRRVLVRLTGQSLQAGAGASELSGSAGARAALSAGGVAGNFIRRWKLLLWNVNGLRAAEKKGFVDWLGLAPHYTGRFRRSRNRGLKFRDANFQNCLLTVHLIGGWRIYDEPVMDALSKADCCFRCCAIVICRAMRKSGNMTLIAIGPDNKI